MMLAINFLQWVTFCLILLLVDTMNGAETSTAKFTVSVMLFLDTHCAGCHRGDESAAKFNIDELILDFEKQESISSWVKVFDRVVAGEMPPKGETQPKHEEIAQVLNRIKTGLTTAGHRRYATQGRAQRRRLNRIEFENTLSDLLGTQIRVAALLPEDGTSHGFSTVDEALTLSGVQMEKYLEAVDLALDTALGGIRPQESKTKRYTFVKVDKNSAQFERKRTEISIKLADSVAIFSSNPKEPPWGVREFSAPMPGRYRIRVKANGYQSRGQNVVFSIYNGFFFLLKGANKQLVGYYSVPPDKPTIVEAEAYLQAVRDTFQIVPYGLPGRTVQGGMKESDGPGLEVHWIEIEGPLDGIHWPPESRTKLLGNVDPNVATQADLERLLTDFAPRAFREPIQADELAPYLALASAQLKSGATFEQALRSGLKAILVSPRFLMLDSQPGRLDGYALASRLSYFLWSTMPDAQLIEAAARGTLVNPRELDQQVERMLNHPKAQAFIKNFSSQWLALNQIDATTPDELLYPEFDELLQVSMLRETQAFFEEILRNDLSVLSFIDSEWGMLNQRLAAHYQLVASDPSKIVHGEALFSMTNAATPLVAGLDVQRVALPPNSHRGGLLTQGAILKVSANGTTTSPVVRGVWLLERLLGAPVPPPPMNVAAIEPDIRGATTIREMLDKHRAADQCSLCHNKIDPPGYALENYDVIGGFRDRYRIIVSDEELTAIEASKNKKQIRFKPGPMVDSKDQLPTDEVFRSIEEFKRLILARPEPVVRNLTERLVIYSTGHDVEFSDREEIAAITESAAKSNYGLRSLVHAIVQSKIFLNK